MNDLYPDLTDEAKEQAQRIIDVFKENMKKVAAECIDDFYCDVSHYIESDHWQNYRVSILNGLCNYNSNSSYDYDFKRIRQAIYHENKEQIDKDLNSDLLEEIERLKKHIEFLEQ